MRRTILKSKPKPMPRAAVVDFLRSELVRRGDGEKSACKVAQESGILCRGFAKYSDEELRRRYEWITRRNPKMSRKELEEIADRWQMARQDVEGSPCACDVQQKVHDTCRGWDDFSNDDLSRYYYELTGKEIVVA